ncbi:MAG: polysaccharide deacetylase family protein [Patescibacteria group bacterium]
MPESHPHKGNHKHAKGHGHPSHHSPTPHQSHHRSTAPAVGTLIFVLVFLALVGAQACIRAQQLAEIRDRSVPPVPPTLQPSIPSTPSTTPHTNFKEITHGDTSKKQVIFTFDAGSGTRSYKGILAALAKHHVKGTFFLVGKWVEQNPELARGLIAAGHEVFNHSYSHPYFTQLTADEIKTQLQKMDDVLASTTGTRTRPYFRAPYGDRDTAVLKATTDAGFQSVYWSVDSLDWREGETAETVKNRVLPNIHPGAIVLMHVGDTPTGDVLDEIFTTLESEGYTLVSLTQGL